jgi:hypothetical protein
MEEIPASDVFSNIIAEREEEEEEDSSEEVREGEDESDDEFEGQWIATNPFVSLFRPTLLSLICCGRVLLQGELSERELVCEVDWRSVKRGVVQRI